MTSQVSFHQTQTREQKFAQLAHEVTKAGGLPALFHKLSARQGATLSQRPACSYLSDRLQPNR